MKLEAVRILENMASEQRPGGADPVILPISKE
jgi:hypothetical protein